MYEMKRNILLLKMSIYLYRYVYITIEYKKLGYIILLHPFVTYTYTHIYMQLPLLEVLNYSKTNPTLFASTVGHFQLYR